MSGLSAVDCGGNWYWILAGTVSADRTWDAGGLPIGVSGDVTVAAGVTLTIAPGQVVKWGNGDDLYVDGTLAALGTSNAPIILTSYEDDSAGGDANADGDATVSQAGDWAGLTLSNGSGASVLEHVEIRYAGNTNFPEYSSGRRASAIVSSSARLENVSLFDGNGRGLQIGDAAPTLTGLTIAGMYDYAMTMVLASDPSVTGLVAEGNGAEAVYVTAGTMNASRTWGIAELPYVLSGDLTVAAGVTWTLEAGVTIKLDEKQDLLIGGAMVVAGTPAAPVTLTSRDDDAVAGDTYHDGWADVAAGAWSRLFIEDTSAGTTLDSLTIRYAGNTNFPGYSSGRIEALRIEADVAATDLRIAGVEEDGIWVDNGATLTVDGGLWTNIAGTALRVESGSADVSGTGIFSADTGVWVRPGAAAALTGSALSGLTTAFRNDNTDFASADAKGNWWGDAAGPNDPSSADGRINVNAAGEDVTDWVDYDGFLTTPPALPGGLTIVGQTPVLSDETIDAVDVFFNHPIAAGTFTAEDVLVTGTAGAVAVASVAQVAGLQYRITFAAPLDVEGNYTLQIGPDVLTTWGDAMDADGDGTPGEAADAWSGVVTLDLTPPEVVSHTPTGVQDGAVGEVDVVFSEAIDPTMFGVDDVTVTTPSGETQPLSVTRLDDVTYRIAFASQSTNGDYTVTVGPDVADLAGNPMASGYDATFTVDRQPVRIVDHDPSGTIETAMDHLDVTFAVPIDASSFTAPDVTIVGPNGTVAVTGISHIADNTYRISFAAQAGEGEYTITIGPDIRDGAGEAMDQDLDGLTMEIEDRYEARVTVDGVGPSVTEISPAATVAAPVIHVDVTFDEPILLASLTAVDIDLTGPDGSVPVTGIEFLDGTTYRLTVSRIATDGTYTLRLGPHVTDLAGTPMDQDGDGTDGEADDDVFVGQFTIDGTGPAVADSSPTGTVEETFSQIELTWSEALDPASFDAADVSLVGPAGAIAIQGLVQDDATTWRVLFAEQQTPGDYTLTVGPDVQDAVGNPMAAAWSGVVTLALPDLTIESPAIPATADAGGELTVSFTVRNAGQATAEAGWWDHVVLSPDPYVGNSDDVLLGQVRHDVDLEADGTYVVTITGDVPWTMLGVVHVFLQTDRSGEVVEGNETNNLYSGTAEVLYVQPPCDLLVESVTIQATGWTGETITVTYRVRNDGTAATETDAWTDRIWLSDSETFGSGTRIALADVAHDGFVVANGSYSGAVEVTLPVDLTAGTWWVFVETDVADDLVEPTGEANNVTRSADGVVVSLSPVADLTVENVAGPATGVIGEAVTVTWRINNVGGATADGPWVDEVFLSPDGTFENAVSLGRFEHVGDLPVGFADLSADVVLPAWTAGAYLLYIVTDADDDVYERDGEANNVAVSAVGLTLQHPDLTAAAVILPDGSTAGSGEEIRVQWTTHNDGDGTATIAWTDGVYLSETPTLDASAVRLGLGDQAAGLAPGESRDGELVVRLPDGIEGTYYILVVTDDGETVAENGDEDNNAAASAALTVSLSPYADLEVSNVTAPETLTGDPVDMAVSWTVTNRGTGAGRTSEWVDRVILSTDEVIGNADDRVVGQFAHDGGDARRYELHAGRGPVPAGGAFGSVLRLRRDGRGRRGLRA